VFKGVGVCCGFDFKLLVGLVLHLIGEPLPLGVQMLFLAVVTKERENKIQIQNTKYKYKIQNTKKKIMNTKPKLRKKSGKFWNGIN
jgi:hypothetical protein